MQTATGALLSCLHFPRPFPPFSLENKKQTNTAKHLEKSWSGMSPVGSRAGYSQSVQPSFRQRPDVGGLLHVLTSKHVHVPSKLFWPQDHTSNELKSGKLLPCQTEWVVSSNMEERRDTRQNEQKNKTHSHTCHCKQISQRRLRDSQLL